MKVTELKDWNTLTPEEQAKLRETYQVGEDDELPEGIGQSTSDEIPATTDTVVINTENVVVNEAEKDNG